MKLKDEEIAGIAVEIHVSTSGGFIVTNAKGDKLGNGYELDKAIAAARATLAKSKVKVSVPFRTTAGETGVATGIHAGTKNVLVRIGGESMQADYGVLRKVLRGDTPSDVLDRLAAIVKQATSLETERPQIEREYKFDLKRAVETAIEEASA